MPPSLDDARLGSSYGLERVEASELLSSGDSARVTEVLAPRGLPPSPSRRLWDEPTLILNWDRSFEGAVEVVLRYGDFLGGLEELKGLPLKEQR